MVKVTKITLLRKLAKYNEDLNLFSKDFEDYKKL